MESVKQLLCRHACQPLTGWPVALLRIATGIMFVRASWGKVTSWGGFTPEGFVQRNLEEGNAFGFMVPFLENVVLKMPGVFGILVAWGELLLGLALILGALTRLSAFFGIVMMFSFLWTKGLTFWAANNYDAMWILILATLMFCGAGRVLGVDRWLHERFGNKPLLW